MPLILRIENETALPDGGPLSVTLSGGRGLDIGRDQHLDWCLPDPSRAVSGRHCEIRFRDGGYWLSDVSTNGTFVNGNSQRVQSPYRLQQGDRLEIGHYLIAVAIEGAEAAPREHEPPPARAASATELWASTGDEAPPIPRKDLLPPSKLRPVKADFIDWASDIPTPAAGPAQAAPPERQGAPENWDWAPHQPKPQPVIEPLPPIPTPRRPDLPPPQANPWSAPDEAAPPDWPAAAATARPPAPAAPQPVAPAPAAISPAEFVQRFARGAGLPAEALAWQDPGAFAEELGGLMRVVAVELKQLLAARAESKRIARSTNQTMIQALDNNPLKFSPTIEDALKLLFGRPTSGYLTAQKAFEESFKDLKTHQVKTYSAMQHALRMLVEDLEPQAVADSLGQERGLEALIGSRKGRMWDAYVARWEAKTAPYEDGLVDAFMLYFAECYDRGGR